MYLLFTLLYILILCPKLNKRMTLTMIKNEESENRKISRKYLDVITAKNNKDTFIRLHSFLVVVARSIWTKAAKISTYLNRRLLKLVVLFVTEPN